MCTYALVFVNVPCGRLDDVNESMQDVSVGRNDALVVAVVVMLL